MADREQPTAGPRLSVEEWVAERLANCIRISEMKQGADRDGWLEDAAYFRAIQIRLEGQHVH